MVQLILEFPYCQAQPKSKLSLAELAIKLDSDPNNNNATGEV